MPRPPCRRAAALHQPAQVCSTCVLYNAALFGYCSLSPSRVAWLFDIVDDITSRAAGRGAARYRFRSARLRR